MTTNCVNYFLFLLLRVWAVGGVPLHLFLPLLPLDWKLLQLRVSLVYHAILRIFVLPVP